MASTPSPILCPVDLSPLSALALRYAAFLADCQKAQLTVMLADSFSLPAYFTEAQHANFARQFRQSRDQAKKELRRFVAKTIPDGKAVSQKVVEGPPAESIQQVASETKAGLIVMGTHGRSGVNRLMMGSVAERVLRSSQAPVLTVRGELPGHSGAPQLKHILCPVNDSDAARRSLSFAVELARCSGADLTVAHVKERHGEAAIGDLCGWVEGQKQPHCTIREVTRKGEAAKQIISLAHELRPDLLVIGSRHRMFFDSTVIGSTTARVVRHAPCPVLTVAVASEERN